MAIDGVKIIDSDDGYDIYNTIVEKYKDGENVDRIIEDVLNDEKNFCTDEFYTEIYWTAFAYSLWKIGEFIPEDYVLGMLAPAHTLNDIYEEITADKKIWHLRFKNTYYLIKDMKEC